MSFASAKRCRVVTRLTIQQTIVRMRHSFSHGGIIGTGVSLVYGKHIRLIVDRTHGRCVDVQMHHLQLRINYLIVNKMQERSAEPVIEILNVKLVYLNKFTRLAINTANRPPAI